MDISKLHTSFFRVKNAEAFIEVDALYTQLLVSLKTGCGKSPYYYNIAGGNFND